MNEHDFVYWLNGFFELSGATTLNEEQVRVIKEHIALVLHKVTPSYVGIGAPQQTRGPNTFPDYPDPSVPWDKPWDITCVAGDANIPPNTYNPFVDPSQQTQAMGTTVSVSESSGTKLTIPPFNKGQIWRMVEASDQPHLCTECVVICPNSRNEEDHIGRTCPLCKVYCKNLEAKDLPIINVPTHLSC